MFAGAAETLGSLLVAMSGEPLLLAGVLFAATFVLEDAAAIAAGLLVARTGADPVAALSGVILGTAAGDLALYAIGRWGAGTKVGCRLRARREVVLAENWIARRVLVLVFVARFLPGSRLPVYTASGLVAAPFGAVAAIIALTTPLWSGALFAAAHFAGEAGAAQFLSIALPIGLAAAGAALMLRRAQSGLDEKELGWGKLERLRK